VDELRAEGHVELEELGVAALAAESRHGDEEVEQARLGARGVEPDGMATAGDPGHHRLGDARGEGGGDCGVGCGTAVGEDLDPGLRRRRVPRRHPRRNWPSTHRCYPRRQWL
jgi:hypothetical protein